MSVVHYFYETVNLINGKKYLGIHSQDNSKPDSYLGSGTLLIEAFKKYGKENFKKTILKYFDTQEEAKEYEASQISEKTLKSKEYYNIAPGGGGGVRGAITYWTSNRSYIVHPDAVEKFLIEHPEASLDCPEHIRDRSRNINLGRVTMNDGKIQRNFKPEEVAQKLTEGWVIGTTSENDRKNSESKKGIRIMHKGDTTRHVKLDKVDEFLAEGFEFGPAQWLNARQGRGHRGLVKIHRDSETRFVSPDKLESFLEAGYVKGSSEQQIQRYKQSRSGKIKKHERK